jgi:hypothetical protein
MDHDLLRSWLALPPGPWPPDHYALLGLDRGEGDPAAVEARVLERMDKLRRHQLLHPELVTEGMNRLAQALITLYDPASRAAYDAELGAGPGTPVPPPSPEPIAAQTSTLPEPPPTPIERSGTQVIEIRFEPSLQPPGPDRPSPQLLAWEPVESAVRPPPYELVPGAEPVPPPVVEGVPVSAPAASDRGVSRRWVYARLALIRKALRAWDKLRSVLADPLDRPGRVLLLLEAAREVRAVLPPLRGLVGGPGEPGGLVAAAVTRPLPLDLFRVLLPDQRQAVAIDWRRGQAELQREYRRLRGLVHRVRPRAPHGSRVLVRWLAETPELVLVLLAAAALIVALVRGLGGQ